MQYIIDDISLIAEQVNKAGLLFSDSHTKKHAVILCGDDHMIGYYYAGAIMKLTAKNPNVRIAVIRRELKKQENERKLHTFPKTSGRLNYMQAQYYSPDRLEEMGGHAWQEYASAEEFKNDLASYSGYEFHVVHIENIADPAYASSAVSKEKAEQFAAFTKMLRGFATGATGSGASAGTGAIRSGAASLVHLTVLEILPTMDKPARSYALSERELDYYIQSMPSDLAQVQHITELEKLCRSEFQAGALDLRIIRTCNVFGPGCAVLDETGIFEITRDIAAGAGVTAHTAGLDHVLSLTSLRSLTYAIFTVAAKGTTGNIYHAAEFESDPYHIALSIADRMAFLGVKLVTIDDRNMPEASVMALKEQSNFTDRAEIYRKAGRTSRYNTGYASNKLRTLQWPAESEPVDLATMLERTCMSLLNVIPDTTEFDYGKYGGKLDLVKELELDTLREVDRICKKHNITYFLVGGSLLGAIRHHGFIPWDDDLDIGMLRDDYEKFRKICPQELDERFAYQSFATEPCSHFVFDKIRLKESYFTTRFSDQFKMQNGIFLDILVYDHTSDNPRKQKTHIFWLERWKYAINLRWTNKVDTNQHTVASFIALPFMRLFSPLWFNKVFEKMLRKYNKHPEKRHYLIDGVGMNLKRGAFPASWFDEIIEVDFEGMKLPVPKEYDAYLRHWYGNHYMELLSISSRNSGHVLNRIDMGPYINRDKDDFDATPIRKQNFDGELYE